MGGSAEGWLKKGCVPIPVRMRGPGSRLHSFHLLSACLVQGSADREARNILLLHTLLLLMEDPPPLCELQRPMSNFSEHQPGPAKPLIDLKFSGAPGPALPFSHLIFNPCSGTFYQSLLLTHHSYTHPGSMMEERKGLSVLRN